MQKFGICPCFGLGSDLRIRNNANDIKDGNNYNYCAGLSYMPKSLRKGDELCGGSLNTTEGKFQVVEYEVFEMI